MATTLSDIYWGDVKRYKVSLPGVDLSNDTFYLCFKENLTDADPGVFQVVKSIHDQTDDDPVNGIIYIKATKANTELLTPNTKYWVGIQWVNSAGDPKTLIVNKIKCLYGVNITSVDL